MIKRRPPAVHVKRYLDSSRIRQRRKRRRTILLALVIILCITAFSGLVYIFRLPQFQYTTLDVSGLKRITRSEVERIVQETIADDAHVFGLVPHTSSFFIDDGLIAERLQLEIPRIKNVQVSSHVNGHLEIEIAERGPFGKWCTTAKAKTVSNISQKKTGSSTAQVVTSSTTSSKSPTVDTDTISIKADPVTEKGTEEAQPQGCYELDINGYIFGDSKDEVSIAPIGDGPVESDTHSSPTYTFKGIIEGNPIGQTYLNQETLTRIASFLKFLKDKNKTIAYVECDSLIHCDIHLSSGSKIIIDISQDLEITIDRFEVALETEGLKNDTYEYVDLRYGNKIFFKLRSANKESSAAATVTNEAGGTIEKPARH